MRRILLPLLLLSLPAAARADDAPLVVGTYAYPARDRAAAIAPLTDYVSTVAGRPTQLRLWPSPSALVAGFRAGEADVIVPNLHAYLQARDVAVTLPVPDVPAEQAARYRAVIVARAVDALDALDVERAASLRLALVGEDSASGGFVPLARLRGAGLTTGDFAQVVYAGSHEAARLALQEGRVEVAALAADVYDPMPVAGATVLWRSAAIPPGPLLCRRDARVPCADIAEALLEAHRAAPAVLQALRAGWPEFGDAPRFVEAGAIADTIDAGRRGALSLPRPAASSSPPRS